MAQKTYEATLVRGQVYYLGDRKAEKGTAIVVTEEEKAHLEEHAVDTLSTSDDNEVVQRQKFTFKEIATAEADEAEEDEEGDEHGDEGSDTGGAAPPPATRVRARARARK